MHRTSQENRPHAMSHQPTRGVRAWLRHPTAVKMISFGLIGLCNAAVDFGIFTLAYQTFELPIVPANVIAWLVAVSCSYVMNTMITFRTESGRVLRGKDYFSFGCLWHSWCNYHHNHARRVIKIIPVYAAKLASILVSFVVNFTMSNLVVFRAR